MTEHRGFRCPVCHDWTAVRAGDRVECRKRTCREMLRRREAAKASSAHRLDLPKCYHCGTPYHPMAAYEIFFDCPECGRDYAIARAELKYYRRPRPQLVSHA